MSEKKPYTAATLRELKMAALLNGDQLALSQIRKYETEIKLYFKLANEDYIRDASGRPVHPEESVFLLVEGFRSASGQIIQPIPGALWNQIERASGTVLVQEVSSREEFLKPKLDAPTKVSGQYREMNGVKFLQAAPNLFFISADSLTEAQIQEYINITEHIAAETE